MVKSFKQGEIVTYREDGEQKTLIVVSEDEDVAKDKQVTYDYNMNPVMLQEYTDYDGDPNDTVFNCVYTNRVSDELQNADGTYDMEKITEKIEENKLKLYAFHSERLQR